MPVSSSGFNRNFQGCISIELSRNFCAVRATALLRYHRAFSKSTKNLKIFFELFYLQNLDFKALADHYILALILMPFRYTLFDRKKNPLNIREFFSVWYIWKERRRRDLNPRAGFPTYTLSRGASSASWVLLLRSELPLPIFKYWHLYIRASLKTQYVFYPLWTCFVNRNY